MRTIRLACVLFVLRIQASLACECITELTETLKQKVDIASLIFYGEVVSIADIESPKPRYHNLKEYGVEQLYDTRSGFEPEFRIIDILKGNLDGEMKEDRFFLSQSDLSICSDAFKVGEKYLVLANRDKNGKIWLRICNPPLVFEDQKAYRAKRKEINKVL